MKVDGEEGEVVKTGSSFVNISHNASSSRNDGSGFFGVSTGLNRSEVMEIVKEALMKYDADKTGMVDHALESAGGNIISTRCTEAYQVSHEVNFFTSKGFYSHFNPVQASV